MVNRLLFIKGVENVYCAVRMSPFIQQIGFIFKALKWSWFYRQSWKVQAVSSRSFITEFCVHFQVSQSLWDLKCTKWRCDAFSSEYLTLLVSVSIHEFSIFITFVCHQRYSILTVTALLCIRYSGGIYCHHCYEKYEWTQLVHSVVKQTWGQASSYLLILHLK